MQQITLQSSVVYGPITSRRLGYSLGVNILPREEKFCVSDCVYCQYGPTRKGALQRAKLPSVEIILEEMEREFRKVSEEGAVIDRITFSGNGEPTLHPGLSEIAQHTKILRDRYFPKVPIGIFSDSSRVHLEEVRQALNLFDARYMKWDAGDEQTFRQINQPMIPIDWEQRKQGLMMLKNIVMQSLFIAGPVSNAEGDALQHWLASLREIRPDDLHVYTVDRAPAHEQVLPVSDDTLSEIGTQVCSILGFYPRVFFRFERSLS